MTDDNLPIVIVVPKGHLEQATRQLTDLMERAQEGDREAEKTLMFAKRYGYDPRKELS